MEKDDVAGSSSIDEQRLRTKLLINLSNALDKFIAENNDEIKQIQGQKLMIKVWHTILTALEKEWWTIDSTMEAIDSIPDILQAYVQRFKKKQMKVSIDR